MGCSGTLGSTVLVSKCRSGGEAQIAWCEVEIGDGSPLGWKRCK